ncbi:hypothetical protein GF402_09720 [Candidatus Fermentibacteria bacterium]|nr:hypothetical protein [Candidatus Fermentibacteria bacterium]
MALRGIVEGFYGKPFDPDQRLRLIESISGFDDAAYLYAPKNDPWHRIRWRRPYPDGQWKSIAEAIARSADLGVRFIFGISPLGFGNNDHRRVLSKAERAVREGAGGLALLFDDLDEPLRPELAGTQSGLVVRMGERFDLPLLVCPSVYCAEFQKQLDEGYTEELSGAIPEEATLLWTGGEVVSRSLGPADMEYGERLLGHRVAAWDNLLADDYCLRRIYMGDVRGRISEGYGYLLNPSSCFPVALHAVYSMLAECGAAAAAPPEFEGHEEGWRVLRMFHYLPWECGPGGESLLEEMVGAITGEVPRGLPERLRKMRGNLRELQDRLPHLSGGYDLLPYVLDVSRFLGIALHALSAPADVPALRELSRLLFERLPFEHPLAKALAGCAGSGGRR